MFERFTDRARRIVVYAQEEARLLNHNFIGTEHLLLGLVHEHDSVAGLVLVEDLGVDLEKTRELVEEMVGLGTVMPRGHIPFTPRAKKVLELALREALQLGHNYIGPEHVLLGLIREGEGIAAQVLVRMGVELAVARQAIIRKLSGYEKEPQDQPPPSPRQRTFVLTPDHTATVRRALRVYRDSLEHARRWTDTPTDLDREFSRLSELDAWVDERIEPD